MDATASEEDSAHLDCMPYFGCPTCCSDLRQSHANLASTFANFELHQPGWLPWQAMQEHKRLLETMSSHNGLPALNHKVAARSPPVGGISSASLLRDRPCPTNGLAGSSCQMSCSTACLSPCPSLAYTALLAQGLLGDLRPCCCCVVRDRISCSALPTTLYLHGGFQGPSWQLYAATCWLAAGSPFAPTQLFSEQGCSRVCIICGRRQFVAETR